jgi:hypothetical protein
MAAATSARWRSSIYVKLVSAVGFTAEHNNRTNNDLAATTSRRTVVNHHDRGVVDHMAQPCSLRGGLIALVLAAASVLLLTFSIPSVGASTARAGARASCSDADDSARDRDADDRGTRSGDCDPDDAHQSHGKQPGCRSRTSAPDTRPGSVTPTRTPMASDADDRSRSESRSNSDGSTTSHPKQMSTSCPPSDTDEPSVTGSGQITLCSLTRSDTSPGQSPAPHPHSTPRPRPRSSVTTTRPSRTSPPPTRTSVTPTSTAAAPASTGSSAVASAGVATTGPDRPVSASVNAPSAVRGQSQAAGSGTQPVTSVSLVQVPPREDPPGAGQDGAATSAARSSAASRVAAATTPTAHPTPQAALVDGPARGSGQQVALVGVILGLALAVAAVVVLAGYRGTHRHY